MSEPNDPNAYTPPYLPPRDYGMQLLQFRDNMCSQNGEDGILRHLIDTYGIEDPGWCCELGAWDGQYLSNTFSLVSGYDWKAIYIEADADVFQDLLLTEKEYPDNIKALFGFIHHMDGKGTDLDKALSVTDIPIDFDILSLDIDGPDYHVWKAMKEYTPKIVVIEYNGRGGNTIQREGAIHKKDLDGGTSFDPMRELGESKGYRLLVDTGNLIFMHEKYLGG